MGTRGTGKTGRRLCLRRDRRGVAGVETACVLLPFLTMLVMTIEIAAYFIFQSALDVGVLTTAETLRTNMMAGSLYSPPTAAALKSTIISNGGSVFNSSGLAVDVQQLSTLSSAALAIADGTDNWGGSGSVLVLRAMATVPFLPGTTTVTMTSTAIVRRPPY